MPNSEPDLNALTDQAQPGDRDPLERQARQLAESHAVSRRPRRGPPLLDRLREQEALLRDAYQYFAGASEAQLALPYAGEWMLDNFYMVQQALRQAREDMPEGYYRRLPKLDTPPLKGYPRIYAVAQEVIAYCEGHLDLDRVTRFAHAYQQVTILTIAELWALPTMLRLGLLELLTQTVARITGAQTDLDEDSPLVVSLPEDVDEAAGMVVANCIRCLRALDAQDWMAFFESVSRVEEILRRDPAGVYAGISNSRFSIIAA